MTIKDELKQYRFKVKKVEQALEEYEKFKARAEKITAIVSDNPSRSNLVSDKVGINGSIMADLELEYQKAWQDAEIERLALIGKIKRIDEPYRTILYLRYVQNRNFEYISAEIGYSYKQVLRLHRLCS